MWASFIKSLRLPESLRGLFSGRTSKRLRLPAAAVLVLGAVDLAAYLLLVVPAADRLAQQERRYRELKSQYAEALLFQKQKQSLAGLEAGVPSQKDIPLLIKDLVQSANRLKLSVGAINSDIPKAGGGLTQITFSVPLSGAYAGIKRFIFDVETTEKLVGIRELKLDSEKGSVRLDMKLVTYIRGE